MPLRAPAVPLVAHDPSFNLWSADDRLAGRWTSHWTGAGRGLAGMVRIDGRTWNLVGRPMPEGPDLGQVACEVHPTRTVCRFRGAGIELELVFCSPLLPDDLEVLARPVTYLTWTARSLDGASHAVSLYVDITGEWAVDHPADPVAWARYQVAGMAVMRVGSAEQDVLGRAGDNVRADWGYVCLAVPAQAAGVVTVMADSNATRPGFAVDGGLPAGDDLDMPRAPVNGWPALCAVLDLGRVGAAPTAAMAMLAFDDVYTVEHLGRRCRAWWRRDGLGFAELLQRAAADHGRLMADCEDFDRRLVAELTEAGGEAYAELCALAYRQCLSAHGLAAELDGSLLHLSKENFSNGCIATVDVTYPGAPFFLCLAPRLLKGQLQPILDYALTPRWRFPFAPHDLGTYPLANGQVYGGGERSERDQMPVEECGNMLILVAAYVQVSGDVGFAARYRALLGRWADYLLGRGLDPEHQLCTDDFAGHLAHNANLSLKAIVALGAWAALAGRLGDGDARNRYRAAAEAMAADWQRMADDGDHYRLTFDRPGTWSQKYNLVWDRLLGLGLFPPEVARREVAWYLRHQERYGLPLDSRCAYTKNDWIMWTATLAEDPADFRALVEPVWRWADETSARVPLTDWYWTTDGRQAGFQARSVVGGFFIKLLAHRLAAGRAG